MLFSFEGVASRLEAGFEVRCVLPATVEYRVWRIWQEAGGAGSGSFARTAPFRFGFEADEAKGSRSRPSQ